MDELPHDDGNADIERERRGRTADLTPGARFFDDLADACHQDRTAEQTYVVAGIPLDGDAPGCVTERSPQKLRHAPQESQQVGPEIITELDGLRSRQPFPSQESMSQLDASTPPPVDHRLSGPGTRRDTVDREAGPPPLVQLRPGGIQDRLLEHPTATARPLLPRQPVSHGADCRTRSRHRSPPADQRSKVSAAGVAF